MVTVDKFMLCPFNFWVVGCTQTISTAVKMNISKLCLHVLYASDMALENGFLRKKFMHGQLSSISSKFFGNGEKSFWWKPGTSV